VEAGVTRTFDLIVIGGGPAGCSAAITAAREGWSVLLLERGRFPRQKVCGEFVSAESLELLIWLLGTRDPACSSDPCPYRNRALCRRTHNSRAGEPGGSQYRPLRSRSRAWSTAEKAGVTALQETTVQRIEGETKFRVATSAGEFGDVLSSTPAGAGPISSRKMTNPRALDGLDSRTFFRRHGTERRPVFFEGGYCGVQPVRAPDGTVLLNACALVRPEVATTLEEVLREHPLLARRSQSWTARFPPYPRFRRSSAILPRFWERM